jgi:hypothetical protein
VYIGVYTAWEDEPIGRRAGKEGTLKKFFG